MHSSKSTKRYVEEEDIVPFHVNCFLKIKNINNFAFIFYGMKVPKHWTTCSQAEVWADLLEKSSQQLEQFTESSQRVPTALHPCSSSSLLI